MKITSFASIITLLAASAQGKEFVDDRGVTFTWPDDASPPTIVVNAEGALSLFHLGEFIISCKTAENELPGHHILLSAIIIVP